MKSSMNVAKLSWWAMCVTRRIAAVLCLAAMTLSGAAIAQSRDVLGEGDSIRITVFQNPDLTTETRISEKGTITFPLIGEVELSGLSPARAEARIADQLVKGKFLVRPQVSVSVVRCAADRYRSSAKSPARGATRSTTPART
jgi:protein involved in polysaccharide export with SLBB domain